MSSGRAVLLSATVVLMATLILTGCKDTRQYCYGVEPDGEVEKLTPCPAGWTSGQTLPIQEDQYADLEVDENGVQKKNKGTGAVTLKKVPQTPPKITTIPPYTPPPKKGL